jgi:ribosome-associated toxin RatA of RatAB toxin-antitoxin module
MFLVVQKRKKKIGAKKQNGGQNQDGRTNFSKLIETWDLRRTSYKKYCRRNFFLNFEMAD